MDKFDDKLLYTGVSAVLETLGDEQNVRVALLSPHTARKLVKESMDSQEGGILSNLTDSILVDLSFRKLLYESRKVQRLYYELDKKDVDLYGKSNTVSNSLLLVDPIRLTNYLKMDLNQAQRVLFMRCFSPKIWLLFLRLISLGVGSKMRELYCLNNKKTISDLFLMDLESFQLSLVEMVLEITNFDYKIHTTSEIEDKILSACKNIHSFSQKIKESWDCYLNEVPLLTNLIPDLNRCVSHIDEILNKKSTNPEVKHTVVLNDNILSSTGSRPFNDLDELNDVIVDNFSFNETSFNHLEGVSYDRHKLINLDIHDHSRGDLNCKTGSNFLSLLQSLSKALMSVGTKSATLISLMKLKILEERQKEFQTLGSFSFLKNEVLRKGFISSNLDENEAVPLLILSHCLGAYCLREWVMRYLVDLKFDMISEHLEESNFSVNSYGVNESAYFRTAGQTMPRICDYFTLVPTELKKYMKHLSKGA